MFGFGFYCCFCLQGFDTQTVCVTMDEVSEAYDSFLRKKEVERLPFVEELVVAKFISVRVRYFV